MLSFALIYSGALPLDEAQRVYLGRVNLFDNALGLAMVSQYDRSNLTFSPKTSCISLFLDSICSQNTHGYI